MTAQHDQTYDESYDVVVVGSGAGAMAAAVTAARNGLSTVVLEKSALLGGTSAYSGAAAWLPGNDATRRAGSADSTESGRAYLRALLGENELDRQEAFLEAAPAVVAELEAEPAIELAAQAFPDYFEAPGRVPGGRSIVPRPLAQDLLPAGLAELIRPAVDRDRAGLGHDPDQPLVGGRALIGRMLHALHDNGGTVRTEMPMTELITTDGRVSGVVVSTVDMPRRIAATRGVLLGSGGFERNQVLRTKYAVPGAAEWAMAPAGTNTGEPIAAAVAVGATTELMHEGWWCPGLATPDGQAAFTLGFRGGVIVDQHGRRFANESLPYDQMGRRLSAEPDRIPAWFVFDSRSGGLAPAITMPAAPAEEHLAAGTWVRADSLASLASSTGLPADALQETVARFNRFATAGVDADFGRGEDEYDRFFAVGEGPNAALVPLDQPPFHAARMVLADLGTKGGLRTDVDARVLGADDRPVEGLYATGNASASLSGPCYPGPGVPIGTAMAFGWRAVQDMLR
ncbi:FAD-dependent oxidoreductase [Nocardioides sp. NPDC057767]|uniref:FAD-dependent oxidoreductase n=1 Tax=unclassified Nocardioides TaxID=2615069 RepID=UPI00366F9A77